MRRASILTSLAALAVATTSATTVASATSGPRAPTLKAWASLPAVTLAPGPASGAAVTGANGVTFPLPSQPVEGFSGIIDGRRPGEYLAMPDNGFGSKLNSADFELRAYYIDPDFQTSRHGDGDVRVDLRRIIQFRDPGHKIGFPIVNEATPERLLTGADLDPESIQRARNGDLWVGDEFGPWILHFDRRGVLVEQPIVVPDGLKSPNNPFLVAPEVNSHPNSRGFEAMAISPNGRFLYAILEGATVADATTAPLTRHVYEYSIPAASFTGRTWTYATEDPNFMVADADAVDANRLVVIERDNGSGATALRRQVFLLDLRHSDAGVLRKQALVDLAAIANPDGVGPEAGTGGGVGFGDPFQVTCESVEAVHILPLGHLLIGCDNNLPNAGRVPGQADDSELIVVKVPALLRH